MGFTALHTGDHFKGLKKCYSHFDSIVSYNIQDIAIEEQENDGVGDISFLFQRHCQTNRLDYKQAVLYIQSWQAVVSQSGEEH